MPKPPSKSQSSERSGEKWFICASPAPGAARRCHSSMPPPPTIPDASAAPSVRPAAGQGRPCALRRLMEFACLRPPRAQRCTSAPYRAVARRNPDHTPPDSPRRKALSSAPGDRQRHQSSRRRCRHGFSIHDLPCMKFPMPFAALLCRMHLGFRLCLLSARGQSTQLSNRLLRKGN